ncbi:hypothetical protein Tco_1398762, partial [Tanacetum coccineum]
MSVVNLAVHLRIEEDNMMAQKNTYTPDFAKASMVDHASSSSKSNPKGKGKGKNDKKSKRKAEYLASKAGTMKMHINLLLNMATKQEGEEDDSEGDEKREHVPRRNVVNFFFTNFLPEWSKVNMYELIFEVGDIAYIYVARKSNQGCKRDGWVFDIPSKLNNLQTSLCGNTRFHKPQDDSILLQSNLEGLNSSLEFIQSHE